MKKTKLSKIKLQLTKETVRVLPTDKLTDVVGGAHTNHCPTLALSCKPCHTC